VTQPSTGNHVGAWPVVRLLKDPSTLVGGRGAAWPTAPAARLGPFLLLAPTDLPLGETHAGVGVVVTG
jgi:hypothetical protein